jgi:geranylgeranyl diphosphate synthase type I
MIPALLSAIEAELQKQVSRLDQPPPRLFHEMVTYHMGWTGLGAGPEAAGKRIRPLLLLLTTGACSAEAQPAYALPAAAAVELVHNFSLVHDDIQDNSPTRRGRPTAWTKWGIPMAINIGDALFAMAGEAILDLRPAYPADLVLEAAALLNDTCLELTRGQFLDMSFEQRTDLTDEDYWPMVAGKTAALLSTCCRIGAILGGADRPRQDAFAAFGHDLGVAFQVRDDILGIWGDESVIGKSAASDLVEGKNSLPILFALGKHARFAARWADGPIEPHEVTALASLLKSEGAYDYAQQSAARWTDQAIANLEGAAPVGEAGEALFHLADRLLGRTQ